MVRTGAGAIKNYSQAMHARSTVGPRETSSSYSLVGVLKAAIKVGLIWACLLQRTQASHQSFCSVIASPCNGYTASQQDAINSAFNNHDCSVVPQLNDMKGHGCNQQTDQDALDDCIDAFIADCPSSPPTTSPPTTSPPTASPPTTSPPSSPPTTPQPSLPSTTSSPLSPSPSSVFEQPVNPDQERAIVYCETNVNPRDVRVCDSQMRESHQCEDVPSNFFNSIALAAQVQQRNCTSAGTLKSMVEGFNISAPQCPTPNELQLINGCIEKITCLVSACFGVNITGPQYSDQQNVPSPAPFSATSPSPEKAALPTAWSEYAGVFGTLLSAYVFGTSTRLLVTDCRLSQYLKQVDDLDIEKLKKDVLFSEYIPGTNFNIQNAVSFFLEEGLQSLALAYLPAKEDGDVLANKTRDFIVFMLLFESYFKIQDALSGANENHKIDHINSTDSYRFSCSKAIKNILLALPSNAVKSSLVAVAMNLMTEEQRFFGSSRYDALGYVIVIELVNRMIPLLTSGIRDMFFCCCVCCSNLNLLKQMLTIEIPLEKVEPRTSSADVEMMPVVRSNSNSDTEFSDTESSNSEEKE